MVGPAEFLLLPTGVALEEAWEESEISLWPRGDEAAPPQCQWGPLGSGNCPPRSNRNVSGVSGGKPGLLAPSGSDWLAALPLALSEKAS